MTEKVISARFEVKGIGTFAAGMSKAKTSIDGLTKADVPSKTKAFEKLADKGALAGAAVAAGIGVAVKKFMDFDAAMSAVKANSGAVGKEFEDLTQLAMDLGASSVFSASEAADGINELAKAGVATRDIMGGGLKGALDLAAAGQVEVGFAAETAATAMVQFNLEGSKVPHIADLLTNAANKAQGGVADMAMALKQSGLVAASTGLSIEETTAGLTAFASAGLIGSDAGTSFKTMLMRLNPQSDAAAAAMEQIGLHAYDAQGDFIGLEMVAGQLQAGLSGLSEEQRAQAITTIFGSDAARAATVLYKTGAAGIANWTNEVSESGAAAKQAATLTDNLKGDLEKLGGAFDTVFIQTGSNANSSLRTLVQGFTGLVDKVGQIPGPVLLAAASLGSLALLAPKGILKWREYKATLDTLGLSMDKISTKAPRTGKALNGIGMAAKGIMLAGTAVAVLGNEMEKLNVEKLPADLAKSTDAVKALDTAINALNKEGFGQGATNVRDFGDVLRFTFEPGFMDEALHGAEGLLSIFGVEQTNDISIAAQRLQEIDQAMSAMISSGNQEQAAALFKQLTDEAAAQGISVDALKAKFPQYAAALAQVGGAATNATGPTAELAATADEVQKSADDAKKALDALRDAILGLGDPVAQQRAANRDYEAAIDDMTASIKENGKTLDAHTEKGRANQQNLDSIRDATLRKVTADFEATRVTKGVEAATAAATTAMKNGRDAFVNAAVAAGKTKTEAEALATQLGLVPKDVSILVEQHGAEAAGAQIDYAARDRKVALIVTERINRQINQTDMSTDRINRRSSAAGNMFKAYAAGGVDVPNKHVAEIAPAGAWRVWAEPETGGESYIPHANDWRRPRAKSILEQTAQKLGGSVLWNASGNVLSFARGGSLTNLGMASRDQWIIEGLLKAIENPIRDLSRAQKEVNAAQAGGKKSADKLKDAQQKLADVQQRIADDARRVADSARNPYEIQGTNARDWVEIMTKGAVEVGRFSNQISDLRKRGLSETVLQQIVGMGAQSGGYLASQLLGKGGQGLIAQMNKSNASLQKAADKLGLIAATGVGRYAGGGAVYGKAGVDKNLALLSYGEHVLDGSDVTAMGGQAGVYAFRRALHDQSRLRSAPISAAGARVSVSIDYARLGQEVATAMQSAPTPDPNFTLVLDGRQAGRIVAAGNRANGR